MLQRDTISSQYYIRSFEAGSFKIFSANKSDKEDCDTYSSTLLISPTLLKTDELLEQFSDLNLEALEKIMELNVEILLVGTGNQHKFPPVELLKQVSKFDFSIDFMETGAACRTFNILANENRRVAAMLFLS